MFACISYFYLHYQDKTLMHAVSPPHQIVKNVSGKPCVFNPSNLTVVEQI